MSAAHTTLAEALAAAQAEFPPVDRDGINPHFRSRFTTLGHLLAKVRPVLNRHGLAVIQLPIQGENGQSMLRTTILHTSGELITADAPLLLARNDPQGQGSAITYMRRYALAAALGISDQDDDDGNAGSDGNQTQAAPAIPSSAAENGASLGGEGDPEDDGGGSDTPSLSPERREGIVAAIKALGLPYKEINVLLGAAGIDALRAYSAKALIERLDSLADEQATALERGLFAEAKADADATEPGDA